MITSSRSNPGSFARWCYITLALVSMASNVQAQDRRPQFPGAGFQIDMLDRVLVIDPPVPLTVDAHRRKVRSALQAGGHVVICRHGATDWLARDVSDDASVEEREDRNRQRNLLPLGVAQAEAIGDAVGRLGVKLAPVLSTFYFRTREFGQIATGQKPEIFDELIATRYPTIETWWRVIAESQSRPTTTFVAAHGQPAGAMKIRLGEGDCAVARADGDKRLNVLAVLTAADWRLLLVP